MSNTPVLDLLADEARWCKHRYAKNKLGNAVCTRSENACQWCLDGAINKAVDDCIERDDVRDKVADVISKKHPEFDCIEDFNDHPSTTHAMVVAVLMEAQV